MTVPPPRTRPDAAATASSTGAAAAALSAFPTLTRTHRTLALLLVACTIFVSIFVIEETWLLDYGRRNNLAYLDPLHNATSPLQHASLARPSVVDPSSTEHLATYDPSSVDGESTLCDDLLLYMPHDFSWEGHGRQLNSYILAAMMATFSNKAMVILEPERSPFKTNSQFGCPDEAWLLDADGKKTGIKNADLEVGLSRLIKHPDWLSSKCAVPCRGTYHYFHWDEILKTRGKKGPYYPKLYTTQEVGCQNDNGRRTKVLLMGGKEAREYFEGHFMERMLERPSDEAYGWAMRLGARPEEARRFAELKGGGREIWDFVSALMVRSGLLEFQPWIARDVGKYVAQSRLPLDVAYDAMHIRRGDKLQEESRPFVETYWNYRAHFDSDSNKGAIGSQKKYIPFEVYLDRLDNEECESKQQHDSGLQYWLVGSKDKPRIVYVATDDPIEVKAEIARLPKDGAGHTVTAGGCGRYKFYFTPHRKQSGTFNEGFHLKDGPDDGGCGFRYWRNIASVADMMIAAKSRIFVGEYNSNWGRLVRMFRLQFSDRLDGDDSSLVVEWDVKVAWGDAEPLPPGM